MIHDTKDILRTANRLQQHFSRAERDSAGASSLAANFSDAIIQVCVATLENQLVMEKEQATLKKEMAELKAQMAELVKPTHIAKPKGLTTPKQ